MSDLLIHDLDPDVQQSLEQRARAHDRDVVEEAKAILRSGLGIAEAGLAIGRGPPPGMGMGTWMMSLVPPECRADDLVFEVESQESPPPDFD